MLSMNLITHTQLNCEFHVILVLGINTIKLNTNTRSMKMQKKKLTHGQCRVGSASIYHITIV